MGAANDPPGLIERAKDVVAFGVLQCHGRGRRKRGDSNSERVRSASALRQDDGALDHVLQLADVAGPRPTAQHLHALAETDSMGRRSRLANRCAK